ncbi:glycoside hydrolase family 88/105 protein [Zobellia galactanivorans]|uniref:glycoside hydrolase family 88/105 protein n=1 Tax=Zobellia galactanivorans (strain DSM 12802 / CCUG 47099 / CIP 106680 / NCIMB 13871 / Dsij) TaxID=63186 RepID=UPI0002E89EFE|nr:glycoside hydrolase family 88 protein [Zobellia galactanivorans]MBU3028015.1 glycoside hydrolase family 88 protein [Zobellia galactanivorans]
MKLLRHFFTAIIIFSCTGTSFSQKIKPKKVKETMQRVADWQIDHFDGLYSDHKKPHHPLDWTNGALYVGMVKWAAMADNDSYYEWLKKIGEENAWQLYRRKYHADDHTVGQMYIELYRKYKDEKMIAPTKEQFNFLMYHPSQSVLNWATPYHQDRWNWCDALFMSPPVWAKLYKVTGEEKYLDFMLSEFKASTDFLFDKEESLYYRDERYFDKLDNGTKVFWSRGNGWVFAGLVNIMNELEPQSEAYAYFLDIYKKMAEKLIAIQTSEGHWAMSLLGQEFYPTPETSGSSFYVYGLAWGINNGILDKKTYEPAVKKGWNAMVSHVTKDGMLGYVQPIGAAPGKAWPDKTEVYGTGAFLSAGSEVYKLYGGE